MPRSGSGKNWDDRHAKAKGPGSPARVLTENIHLLPSSGKALDLACGRGVNALLLAEAGLQVDAWDNSPVAIQRLSEAVQESGLQIHCEVRDVVLNPPPANSYDVILVAHFLERSLTQPIIHALRENGLLLYQTFTQSAVTDTGPSDQTRRLGDNELLDMFTALKIRVYREELLLGDHSQGLRDMAMLVAHKVS